MLERERKIYREQNVREWRVSLGTAELRSSLQDMIRFAAVYRVRYIPVCIEANERNRTTITGFALWVDVVGGVDRGYPKGW
jgi:hypothetical protein